MPSEQMSLSDTAVIDMPEPGSILKCCAFTTKPALTGNDEAIRL